MKLEDMKNLTEEDVKRITEKGKTYFAWMIAFQEMFTLSAITQAAISICIDCGDMKGLQIRAANMLHLINELKTGCDELTRQADDPDVKLLLNNMAINTTDIKARLLEAEKEFKKAKDGLDAAIAQYEERESA